MDKETMKHTRMLVGLAAAVGALAVSAVPAMGHEFVASKTGTLSGKGYEEIPPVEKGSGEFRGFEPEQMQSWKFGGFTIYCYSASSKGEVTETTSNVLQLTTKYGACGWYPNPKVDLHSAAAFASTGITVKYHANGFVETLENGEEVEYKGELLPSSASIKVSGKVCKIEIPAQTIPIKAIKHPEEEFSSVLYSNFTTPVSKPTKVFTLGVQEKVRISNNWKGIKYHFGGEENQCTNPEYFEKQSGEEGGVSGGSYKGQLEAKLGGGNLKYE